MSQMVRLSSLSGIILVLCRTVLGPVSQPCSVAKLYGTLRIPHIKTRGKSPVLWSGLSWVDASHRVNPYAPYPLVRIVHGKWPLNLACQLLWLVLRNSHLYFLKLNWSVPWCPNFVTAGICAIYYICEN